MRALQPKAGSVTALGFLVGAVTVAGCYLGGRLLGAVIVRGAKVAWL